MQFDKEKSIHSTRRLRTIRAVLGFVAASLLFLAMIQSLTVTVAWWRHELPALQVADWFWILLLPVLFGIFLRCFSLFRPDCRACLPADRLTNGGPRGP